MLFLVDIWLNRSIKTDYFSFKLIVSGEILIKKSNSYLIMILFCLDSGLIGRIGVLMTFPALGRGEA